MPDNEYPIIRIVMKIYHYLSVQIIHFPKVNGESEA